MATRSITTVRNRWNSKDEWETLAVIYCHWDGYPSVQGACIYKLLDDMEVINGIPGNPPPKFANGAGRLASQLVTHLQKEGRDPDLMSKLQDSGQEFQYQIDVDADLSIKVTVFNGPMTLFGAGGDECNNEIFSGTVEEFGEFLETEGDE